MEVAYGFPETVVPPMRRQ